MVFITVSLTSWTSYWSGHVFSRSISYHLCVTNESMNFFSLTLSSRFLFLLLYWYGRCLERTRLEIFYSVVGRFIIFRSNNVVENSFTNKFIEKFSLIKITRDSSNFRFHFLLEIHRSRRTNISILIEMMHGLLSRKINKFSIFFPRKLPEEPFAWTRL